MEFSSTQIAKLVLGYLKTEKCYSAYKEFLSTSHHLQDDIRPKFMVTRVAGLSLSDFLAEYALLYNIIQERLEESDYYNTIHVKQSLSEQLLYLLENEQSCRRSRSASRCRSPPRKKPRMSDISTNTELSESGTFDINTTPLDTLPGNVGFDTSKTHNDEDSTSGEERQAIDVEVVAQTLLENRELHEKLAEAINTTISTSLTSTSSASPAEEKNTISQDIDTAIRTILEKTASDPLFDKLVEDIIENADEVNINTEVNKEELSKQHKTLIEHKQNEEQIPPVQQKSSDESVRVVTSEKQSTQNFVSYQPPLQPIITLPTYVQSSIPQKTMTSVGSDIVVVGNSLENYIKGTSAVAANTAIMSNSGGLLMVQTNPVCPTGTSENVVNSCYIINSDPQQRHIITSVNEQDILSMPIVYEEDHRTSATSVPSNVEISKRFVNIAPKQSLAKYVATHKCEDSPKQSKTGTTDSLPMSSKLKPITRSKNNAKATLSKNALIAEGNNQANEKKTLKVRKPKKEEPTNEPEIASEKVTSLPNLITPKHQVVEEKQSSSTPHSASHVRALDFSTPPKLFSPRKMNTATTPKDLFDNKVEKKAKLDNEMNTKKQDSTVKAVKPNLGSWDSDLRVLIGSEENTTRGSQKKKAKAKEKSRVKKKEEKANNKLNTTCEDGKLIEKALLNLTPEDADASGKDIPADESDLVQTKEHKELSKNATNCVPDVLNNEKTEGNTHREIPKVSDNPTNSVSTNKTPSKSNIKKKCNPETGIRKDATITKIKEIKYLEFSEDTSNKLILSPSKLNASKRTLIEVVDALSVPKVTPDNTNIIADMPISAAKRNITPLLETPMKLDLCPKTPGFFSPVNTTDTPLTRVLKEQLQGVDISTIPTPKFPLTPKFPFTPTIEDLCYANRPTDYSSSSSYYLPSDTENNKSLEQILFEESKRLENISQTTPIVEVEKASRETIHILSDIRIPSVAMESGQNNQCFQEQLHETHKVIADKMKSMSNNTIGRKNLNLVKTVNENSSSSSSSSDSSSSSTESDDSWTAEGNNTVIVKPQPKAHALRTRQSGAKPKNTESSNKQTITDIINNIEIKKTLDPKKPHNLMDYRESVLAEMEEKKKKTIEIFKNENVTPGKSKSERSKKSKNTTSRRKLPQRDQHGKFRRSSARIQNQTKNVQNSPATKTTLNKDKEYKDDKQIETTKQESVTNVAEVEHKVLHVSSDDEHLEPFEIVKTELHETSTSSMKMTEEHKENRLDISMHSFQKALDLANSKQPEKKSEVPAEERRAENLVKELKEWGIHLIHKKSPMDQEKLNVSKQESENSKSKSIIKEKKISVKKHDVSLEEGEIVSDLEEAKEGKIESRKSTTCQKKSSTGKVSNSKTISQPLSKNRKQKSPGKCRKVLQSETRKKVKSHTDKKNNKDISSESTDEAEVVFDYKLYSSETMHLVHDSSKPPPKKLSDYDVSLLLKKIGAKLYFEESYTEVQKHMTVTPIEFLLDIPSKTHLVRQSKNTSTDSGTKSSRKMRPLELLNRELHSEPEMSSFCATASPLDDLYSSEKGSYVKNLSEKQSRERSTKTSKTPAKRDSRSARSTEEIRLEDNKSKQVNTPRRSSERLGDKESAKESDVQEKKIEKLVGDLSKSSIVDDEVSSRVEYPMSIETLDVVDGVIMLNTTSNESIGGQKEDDLMNYAVVGTPEKSGTKRKADNMESHPHEKKIKTKECKELLKKIDVDSFLQELHGQKNRCT